MDSLQQLQFVASRNRRIPFCGFDFAFACPAPYNIKLPKHRRRGKEYFVLVLFFSLVSPFQLSAMIIRPIRSLEEVMVLKSIDTSFVTSHIFRVQHRGQTFSLIEQAIDPPIWKFYSLADLSTDLLSSDYTVLGEDAGSAVGFASMRFELWNKRSNLRHLYVAPEWRGKRVGFALVEAISSQADAIGSRCLWIETQNTNYAAVRFYFRLASGV